MTFILISDAVRMTGLDRQTIRNWIAKGIIPSKKINGTFYVDKETFEDLSEQMRDVDNARKSLEVLKDEYHKEKSMFSSMKESVRDEHNALRLLSVCVNSAIRIQFFDTIVSILGKENILSEKEAGVLTDLLNGASYQDVSERYKCTRERVRQIAEKAIRKSAKLTHFGDAETIKAKDEEIAVLKEEISALTKMVYRKTWKATEGSLTDAEKRLVHMDSLELYTLLSRKLFDEDISVRALNALTCYKKDGITGIRTVGELCQITMESIVHQRNVGRKTVDELTAYLKSKGLEWGMNIDKVKELRS